MTKLTVKNNEKLIPKSQNSRKNIGGGLPIFIFLNY